jgi:tetratricopeptide (TPR) repeat protein
MTTLNLIFILIGFLLSSSYASSDLEKNFKEANNQFLSGDYQKSIELYEKLLSDGFSGASLHYNLANAYYRIGKIGLAILHYEKAKKFLPKDENINHNLNFVKLQTKDKVEKLPEFFVFELWENALAIFNANQLTIISYVFFLIILISVLTYIISKNYNTRRISFYSIFIALIIFVISTVLLTVRLNRDYNVKYGVIISASVVVKSSPDPFSKDSFIIHEGLKVKIEDKIDNWLKIRLEDGKVGWLDKNSLGVI